MTEPTHAGEIPSDLKQQIDAYIRDELARLQANANPEAPVLTPEETVAQLLANGYAAERAEKATPSSSGRTHEIILTILSMLVERVMPITSDQTDEAGN